MKRFAAFVRKEFRHVFRDRRTMLILLGMPVVQIILFGFALSTEIRNIDIALVIPQENEMIRQIAAKLDANDYCRISKVLRSTENLDKVFLDGSASMAVAFSDGFAGEIYSAEGSSIQLITDATNTNTARTATMYVSSIIRDFFAGSEGTEAGIQPNIKMLYNPQMRSSYSFVPGMMGLIIILICAMMTAVSIVREKESGTMELLLVSPTKPLTIIMAKMIPYLTLSFINFLTILILSMTLLDVPMSGSFAALCLLSVIYIVLSLALGLLISIFTDTQIAAMLGSGMVLLMPVMFFSGLMFPIESMPGFFQAVADFIPAKWYVSGIKKLMIEGLSIRYVTKEILILSAMAALLIAVSLKSFKYRLK